MNKSAAGGVWLSIPKLITGVIRRVIKPAVAIKKSSGCSNDFCSLTYSLLLRTLF